MRKLKAYPSTLYDNNIAYFAFSRVKRLDGVTGYRYILSKALTDEQKQVLEKYNNVCYGTATYRYAPEQKYNTIILLDKCL